MRILALTALLAASGPAFGLSEAQRQAHVDWMLAALPEVHQLVSAGLNNSMPSSHAANWAAATPI